MKTRVPKSPDHRPLMEELEPRLLFSADGLGVLVDPAIHELDTLSTPPPVIELVRAESTSAATAGGSPDDTKSADSAIQRREVVFVDADTPNYRQLIDALLEARADGRSIDVVILDGDRDGIEQISEALAKRQQHLDAVHIISHGANGVLELGNQRLDEASLLKHARSIGGWRQALTAEADLLLYGCDLASGPQGRAMVDALGRLTGADVAASTDQTGHARLDGDWDLEYQRGDIETEVAVSAEVQSEWEAVLPTPAATDDAHSVNEDATQMVNWRDSGQDLRSFDPPSNLQIRLPLEKPVTEPEDPVFDSKMPIRLPLEKPATEPQDPVFDSKMPIRLSLEKPVTEQDDPVFDSKMPIRSPVEKPAAEPQDPVFDSTMPIRSPLEKPVVEPQDPIFDSKMPIRLSPEKPVTEPGGLVFKWHAIASSDQVERNEEFQAKLARFVEKLKN